MAITQKLGFDASQAVDSLTQLTKKLGEANAQLEAFQKNAKEGTGVGTATKGVSDATKRVQTFTLSWRSMLRAVGTRIATGMIANFLNEIKQAVVDATEFRLRLAEVQTIGSDLAMTTDQLSKRVLNLSASLGKSAEDVAEGLYQVLSNQVVEAADAFKLLETSQKLAIITHGETKDAVNAVSSVMNSYGKSIVEVDNVADTLFRTVEFGRLRLADIANILGRVTPLTARMGVTFEEAAAAIATMTRSGVKADTAVTQLRAVMQKLIKPTNRLREIFRSWGVEDGAAAIKTFGGLTAVLQKLAQETGGSDAEMAELFRRVRAIVGVMGIMTDDGKEMAEVMEEMAKTTAVAAEAWEAYSNTDSHRLVVAYQEVKKASIEFGSAVIPILTSATEWFGRYVKGVTDGVRVINAAFDRSVVVAFRMQKTIEKINREIEESRKQAGKALKEEEVQYKKLQEAAFQAYAEVNKQEQQQADIRDARIKRAGKVYKQAANDVVNHFESQASSLEEFIKGAAKSSQEAAKEAAKIQGKIDERLLDKKLKRTKSVNAKIAAVNKEHAKRQEKTAEAIAALDGGKRAKEAALAAIEQEKLTAERLLALRKEKGNKAFIQRAEDQITSILMKQKLIIEETDRKRQEAIPKAKEQLLVYQEQVDKVRELLKQLREVETSGDLDSDNQQIRRSAETRKKALEESLGKAYEKLRKGDEFIQSLGLETARPLVTDMLQSAFDAARINWDREVKAGQKAFEEFTKTTGKELKRKTEQLGYAEQLAGPRGDRTTGTFLMEAEKEARKILKENAEQTQAIEESRIKINNIAEQTTASLKTAEIFQRGLTKAESEQLSIAQKLGVQWARIVNIHEGRIAAAEKTREFTQQNAEAAWLAEEAVGKWTQQLKENAKALESGKGVSEEILQNQYKQILAAGKRGELEKDFVVSAYEVLQSQLLGQRELVALKAREAKLAQETAKTEAARGFTRNLKEQGAAQLEKEAKARSKAAQEANKVTEATVETEKASNKAAEAAVKQANKQQDVAKASGEVKTQQNGMIINQFYFKEEVNKSLGAVQNLEKGLESATKQAAELKRTMSGSGSGVAAQYFGGPMKYFAAGGPARGSDNIPAMLARGETVISRRNSQRFFSQLNAMNQGSQPVYREQGGPVTNVGDINVSVNGGDTSQQTVREIGRQLQREIKRGTLKLS